jgi:hypothetical protein
MRKLSSSALRAPESSSFGSMPTARITAFAVPLNSSTTGLKNQVKPICSGATIFAVASGTARAKFFGISSPKIIENSVAMTIATIAPTAAAPPPVTPSEASGSRSSELIAGSNVYPASRVVSVMPSCADERWVDVTRSALMVGVRRFSPRLRRRSRSGRSRLTRENSDATKTPVPRVRSTPARMPQSSVFIAHPADSSAVTVVG